MAEAWCWVSSLSGGAIACVEFAGDIDWAFSRLGVVSVEVAGVRVRSVPVGVNASLRDEALVARWSEDRATVMTHGGRAVVDGLLNACRAAGIAGGRPDARDEYPEAADAVEAEMLRALARVCSPVGVELLLDQPRRWREAMGSELHTLPPRGEDVAHRDVVLRRLIDPVLVVAVGPPNVGKSSLLNALAGRGVSVVADAPGTTRDHVGALVDLGGVVVRWVDTPGLEEEVQMHEDAEIQREAQQLALEVAARADLLLVCGDSTAQIQPPSTSGATVRVGLRTDLGRVDGMDAAVSVRQGVGLERLVTVVREAVVPRRLIESAEPWAFW
ncbi:MAG: 50S ribosome-binding GTPase [Phycisphaerales bacterium]